MTTKKTKAVKAWAIFDDEGLFYWRIFRTKKQAMEYTNSKAIRVIITPTKKRRGR